MKPTDNNHTIESRVNRIINTIVKLFQKDERFSKDLENINPKVDLKYNYSKGEVEIKKIEFPCDRGYSSLLAAPHGVFFKHYSGNNEAELLIGYEDWSIFE